MGDKTLFQGIEEFQRLGQFKFDVALQGMTQVNKGLHAIATEVTQFSKKSFEESTAALEKLIAADTVEQAMELHSSYARRAYDDYVAEMTKLGEMYVDLAKEAYKPVGAAFSK